LAVAAAVAFAYPNPEKGGRGKKGNLLETSGFSRQRLGQARQLIGAAQVVANLQNESVTIVTPAHESQVRPLTRLEPEQQRQAWAAVTNAIRSPSSRMFI